MLLAAVVRVEMLLGLLYLLQIEQPDLKLIGFKVRVVALAVQKLFLPVG